VFDGMAEGVPDPTMCYYGSSPLTFH
jgi:hypothetical protein